MLVVEEVAAIEGGAKEAYLEAVRTKLAPLVERRAGGRLIFVGSTIGSTGAWPEAIALFELDDWDAWGRWVAALASADDTELRAWREECAPLRERSRNRTLVAASSSPSLAELRRRGIEAKAYSFARYVAAPGREGELVAAIERLAVAERVGARELVGLYETAWTEGEVTAVWCHRDLASIAARSAMIPAAVTEWQAATREVVASIAEHWAFSSPGGPLWPRGEASDVKVW